MASVISFFDRGWQARPDALAYVMADRTWRYDDVYRTSCRVAHALLADPAQPRHVAVLAGNDPAAWECILGVWRAGRTWVPLNIANAAPDLSAAVDAFDVDVVLYHSSVRALAASIAPGVSRQVRWVCLDGEAAGLGIARSEWLAGVPERPPEASYDPNDVVAILPTGGTTGRPKGVMHTHRSLGVAFLQLMLAFSYETGAPVVNLAAAPMTHAAGLLTLPCLARGGTVVVLARPDVTDVLDAVERHAVTELFLPPTVIYRVLDSPELVGRDLSGLRYLLYGAAPIALGRLREAVERLGPVLMGGYGQMEAPMSISFLTPPEHVRDGAVAPDPVLASCGRPSPLVQVEVRDGDGRRLPPGGTGEICVRGDLVMKGYYRRPDLTAGTVVDGWLRTGDLGHVDQQGRLHITDRMSDVIITGGSNVYPNDVEQVLAGHPSVQECAVVGVPDEQWGERVVAYVQAAAGSPFDESELLAWCRERLGGVRAPKRISVLPALPRTPAGKIRKTELRRVPLAAGDEL